MPGALLPPSCAEHGLLHRGKAALHVAQLVLDVLAMLRQQQQRCAHFLCQSLQITLAAPAKA